jgi:hypothetical protein
MVGGLMLPRASKSKRLGDEIAAASGHRFSPPLAVLCRSFCSRYDVLVGVDEID